MSVDRDTTLDSSINLRRSLRHTNQQAATPVVIDSPESNDKSPGDESTGIQPRRSKRVKLDPDEEIEESPVKKPLNRRGRKRKKKKLRLQGGEFPSRRGEPAFPLRRSTREKRLIFATFNSAEMIRQVEQPFSVYDQEDSWMDPYEKLLSPRRYPRRGKFHDANKQTPTKPKITSGEENNNEQQGDEDQEEQEENDSCKGEGETDQSDDDDQSGDQSDEHSEGEVGYYLRKRRPVIYQYQPVLQVVDDGTPPKTRRQRRTSAANQESSYKPRSRRGAFIQPKAVTSARNRKAQHHGSSSTSSSGSDSDEAKFRRRKKRSMAKARSMCLPMNFDRSDLTGSVLQDRARIGASLADVDPMNIDRGVTFESIGGHKQHIRALKEMIVFPLLYPEVFDRFKISPPRGVLFSGPPGCGKTLMARALANECSKEGKKVAFFMRKGADCLSKWVGESERQLRLLFDQAYQMRPSIIFFDEIDGLAPVRSSRQDQIHSSIVSTLLALMDGLDNRGEIVIIGATNRIDAIDPALRRPGRFDREFIFPLPSREDRLSILGIHTREWEPQIKPTFLSELAEHTVGYCGADLKSLCTEAALCALRRKYPQIYSSAQKLVLDVSSINVQASDFHRALKSIVPTAQRSDASPGRALAEPVRPLFLESLKLLLAHVGFVFPPAWKSISKALKDVQKLLSAEDELMKELKVKMRNWKRCNSRKRSSSVENWSGSTDKTPNPTNNLNPLFQIDNPDQVYFDLSEAFEVEASQNILVTETNDSESQSSSYLGQRHPHTLPAVFHPRLIVCGPAGNGQNSHLTPALLHAMDGLSIHTLDLPTLYAVSSKTPEEACTQIIREAKRLSPSIVYLPGVSSWWESLPMTFQPTLLSLLASLPPHTPLLLLATADCPWDSLSSSLQQLFTDRNNEVFSISSASYNQRQRFFSSVLLDKPLLPPPLPPTQSAAVELEELPVAPPPEPRQLTSDELAKIEKQRESVLRELRIFLRDTTNKLLAERKFKEFVKPVNPEEVPDYYEIVINPMDLSTIMRKIDEHRYTTPKQWLADVNLITMNSLEYNPEHDSESRLLRHRAVALQDMASSILDHELSEDFEKQCEEIADTYNRIGKDPSESSPIKKAQQNKLHPMSESSLRAELYSAPRRSLRQQGLQAEEKGFDYYSPSKTRLSIKFSPQPANETSTNQESENLLSEPPTATRRTSLQNSNVRRQIIRPWEDTIEKVNDTNEQSSVDTCNDEGMDIENSPVMNGLVETSPGPQTPPATEVVIDKEKLVLLFERIVSASESSSCEKMEKLHATFDHLVFRYRMSTNRSNLIDELELATEQILGSKTR